MQELNKEVVKSNEKEPLSELPTIIGVKWYAEIPHPHKAGTISLVSHPDEPNLLHVLHTISNPDNNTMFRTGIMTLDIDAAGQLLNGINAFLRDNVTDVI